MNKIQIGGMSVLVNPDWYDGIVTAICRDQEAIYLALLLAADLEGTSDYEKVYALFRLPPPLATIAASLEESEFDWDSWYALLGEVLSQYSGVVRIVHIATMDGPIIEDYTVDYATNLQHELFVDRSPSGYIEAALEPARVRRWLERG